MDLRRHPHIIFVILVTAGSLVFGGPGWFVLTLSLIAWIRVGYLYLEDRRGRRESQER